MTSKRAERPNTIPWPPIILLATIAAGLIAHWLYPLGWPGGSLEDLLQGLGLFAIALALALYFFSVRALIRHNTTFHPAAGSSRLVTTGPFAVTRNPIYLANVIALTGLGMAVGVAWFFAAAIICAFLEQKLAIEREEAHLEAKFGKAWRDYRKRARRWL